MVCLFVCLKFSFHLVTLLYCKTRIAFHPELYHLNCGIVKFYLTVGSCRVYTLHLQSYCFFFFPVNWIKFSSFVCISFLKEVKRKESFLSVFPGDLAACLVIPWVSEIAPTPIYWFRFSIVNACGGLGRAMEIFCDIMIYILLSL